MSHPYGDYADKTSDESDKEYKVRRRKGMKRQGDSLKGRALDEMKDKKLDAKDRKNTEVSDKKHKQK